jgi:hypothetical protein
MVVLAQRVQGYRVEVKNQSKKGNAMKVKYAFSLPYREGMESQPGFKGKVEKV